MKKLFIICSILLISVFSYAQESGVYFYKATSFQSKPEGGEWSAWQDVDINVKFYTDNKRINIYSTTPQYIDYTSLETETLSDRTIYTGMATDTQYRNIQIRLVIWNDGDIILEISYSDF